MTHPTCGTCDLTHRDGPNLWCHGAPPSCWQAPKVEIVDGAPVHTTATWSSYPPVSEHMIGCSLHPTRRKRGWWRRLW